MKGKSAHQQKRGRDRREITRIYGNFKTGEENKIIRRGEIGPTALSTCPFQRVSNDLAVEKLFFLGKFSRSSLRLSEI